MHARTHARSTDQSRVDPACRSSLLLTTFSLSSVSHGLPVLSSFRNGPPLDRVDLTKVHGRLEGDIGRSKQSTSRTLRTPPPLLKTPSRFERSTDVVSTSERPAFASSSFSSCADRLERSANHLPTSVASNIVHSQAFTQGGHHSLHTCLGLSPWRKKGIPPEDGVSLNVSVIKGMSRRLQRVSVT